MSFPVILIDSASGSDTLASGAGPTSPLNGNNAATDGSGDVSLSTDAPDLSGVPTDGTAAIYVNSTTAGHRNFSKITAINNTTKLVTVDPKFPTNLTGPLAWAIGGKRASIGGTNSVKLFNNNSAAGDAMPGWVVEMLSGHAETISTAIGILRAGDMTDGPILLRGTPGAATMPVITQSANTAAFSLSGGFGQLHYFKIKNSNGTKTSAHALSIGGAGSGIHRFVGMTFGDATDKIQGAWSRISGTIPTLEFISCGILHANSNAFLNDFIAGIRMIGCRVSNCGGGVDVRTTNTLTHCIFESCVFDNNTGDAIICSLHGLSVKNCVFHDNTGDGIEVSGNGLLSTILSNLFTENGGYGINASVGIRSTLADYNAFRNNTSGARNNLAAGDNDVTLTADPYTDAANGDFTLNNTAGGGAACRDAGFPQTIPGT